MTQHPMGTQFSLLPCSYIWSSATSQRGTTHEEDKWNQLQTLSGTNAWNLHSRLRFLLYIVFYASSSPGVSFFCSSCLYFERIQIVCFSPLSYTVMLFLFSYYNEKKNLSMWIGLWNVIPKGYNFYVFLFADPKDWTASHVENLTSSSCGS